MGREKRSGMPRQEGKTSRKSQGRTVDGAWEEKKGLGCPVRKEKPQEKVREEQ